MFNRFQTGIRSFGSDPRQPRAMSRPQLDDNEELYVDKEGIPHWDGENMLYLGVQEESRG